MTRQPAPDNGLRLGLSQILINQHSPSVLCAPISSTSLWVERSTSLQRPWSLWRLEYADSFTPQAVQVAGFHRLATACNGLGTAYEELMGIELRQVLSAPQQFTLNEAEVIRDALANRVTPPGADAALTEQLLNIFATECRRLERRSR